MKKKIIIPVVVLSIFGLSYLSTNLIQKNFSTPNESNNTNFIKNNEKDEYFLTINGDATYRTGDINKLYESADIVLVADYQFDEETIIEKNQAPKTIASFKVNKILKNNMQSEVSDTIRVQYSGGVITLKQLLDSRDEAFARKLGVNNISNEEASRLKVQFNIDGELGDKNLKEHKTRLLLLHYNKESNLYEAIQNRYGMLSYNSSDNTAFDIQSGRYITYSFLK